MKETARRFLEEAFIDWCDAIEADDKELIKVCYNQFTGACELYEELFKETVYYRTRARAIRYEEN